jgi:hypothetical protein
MISTGHFRRTHRMQSATPAEPAWPSSGIAGDAYPSVLTVGTASGALDIP